MKGNKFLAALLAASMTFSVVPVTTATVFAAASSIDSVTINSWTVSVDGGDEQKESDLASKQTSEEYRIGNALKQMDISSDTLRNNSGKATLQALVTPIQNANEVFNVESTSVSDNGDGIVVVKDQDGTVLTYTFTTKATDVMSDDEIKALDSVFENVDAITYDGKTIGTAVVQAAFNKALNKAKADAGTNTTDGEKFFGADTASIAAGDGYDYKYTVMDAKVEDGFVKGKLVRTGDGKNRIKNGTTSTNAADAKKANVNGTVYTYEYTAKAVQNTDSQKVTVKKALDTIAETTYPQPLKQKDGATDVVDGGTSDVLNDKIKEDINAALDGNGTVDSVSGTLDLATRTSDGSYNISIQHNNVNVPLKYSSDSKLNDAINLASKTTLKSARTADTLYSLKVDSTPGTQYQADAGAGTVKDGSGNVTGKVQAVKKFSSTSAFSRSIQARTATKAVDSDTVKDAVLKLFTDAADTAKYSGDGVTYTAEPVKFSKTNGNATTDDTVDATINNEGLYLIKVTATIDNDFAGWTINNVEQKNAISTATWYVEVETPKLKEVKNTGISFADRKVVYTTNAYRNKSTSTEPVMKIDLKAVLTPDGSNSDVTYKIVTNDKDSTGTLGKDETGNANGYTYYTKATTTSNADGTVTYTGDSTTTYTGKNSELYVPGAGTYKISATANGKTATATITVLSKFSDVPATAYYSDAVNWAYANGITAGTNESTFGSYSEVTRAQFVTWLYKYAVSKDSTVAIADSDVKAVFSDVPTDKFYAKAVQWAAANKVTSGTTATTFSPDAPITRAQALTMLWHVKGEPLVGLGTEDEVTKQFTDLPSNPVFKSAIVWAIHAGVTKGTTPTTCSPDNICPRSQAITFML